MVHIRPWRLAGLVSVRSGALIVLIIDPPPRRDQSRWSQLPRRRPGVLTRLTLLAILWANNVSQQGARAMTAEVHYQEPGGFTRKVFNPLVAALTRMGV